MSVPTTSDRLDSCSVLVLDDDDILVEFVATVLEREGAQVTRVQDGAAGVSRAATDPPDVVVSDWRMPGLDGLEVLSAIRESSSSTAFVMMSAYHTPSLRQACTKASADAFLQKPFRPSDLIQCIHSALPSAPHPSV
jgi:CheY-like chemotaxis protein